MVIIAVLVFIYEIVKEKKMKNDEIQEHGITFLGVLAIAFIVLKLCGVMGWAGGWVLAPLWGPAVVYILYAIILIAIAYIKDYLDGD